MEITAFVDKKEVKSITNKMMEKYLINMRVVMKRAKSLAQENAPVDNTTYADRIRSIKERKAGSPIGIAFVKDNKKPMSKQFHYKTKRSKKTVTAMLYNDAPYAYMLEEGLMNESPLLTGALVNERTPDGRFSEQAPKGKFMRDAVIQALKENRYRKVEIK